MKYWKVLTAAAMLLGLTACGGGGGDDKNDPPPAKPGDTGSVVFTAEKPQFVQVDDGKTKALVERLAVNFTVTDSQGNPIDLSGTEVSFSVAKLIPGRKFTNANAGAPAEFQEFSGPTVWKSFIYTSDLAKPPSASSKATFEKTDGKSGKLESLGNGQYRYVFGNDVKNIADPYRKDGVCVDSVASNCVIAWDDAATHRLAVTFGSAAEDSTMALVNYTQDWVPAGGTAALTRDVLELESCSDCHMGQPIHHGSRNDPKVCVACHNESNPSTTRRSLAVIAHDVHSAGKTTNAMSGNYPQDPRNCDTCHKPATATTPDAANWTIPTEATCKACHADYGPAGTGHHANQDCRECHADGNVGHAGAGVTNVHINRLKGMQAGADTLGFEIKDATYDAGTKAVTVELFISKDGAPISDMTVLTNSTYLAPGLLVNWDDGEGNVLPISSKTVKLADCAGGNGSFTCVTPAIEKVPTSDAVLNVTVADMGLCVQKKATELDGGAPAGLVACQPFATIAKDRFEYIITPNIPVGHFNVAGGEASDYQLPIGADKALCESCHKDFNIHFSGTSYDHAARDFNQCASCHNANRASHYVGMPGDLKYHVHSYHSMGSHRGAAHAATPDEANKLISFPGKVNNCESCHTKEQFNIPNQKNARPSVVSKLLDDKGTPVATDDVRADKFYSPTLVVCASCHLKSELGNVKEKAPVAGDEWAGHMLENGAVFGADTAEGAIGHEQCASCHDIGGEQGVDKVHKVFDFR